MAEKNDSGSTADREIVITRTFNAPRELMFEAWTAPKHLPYWWGSTGFTNTLQEIDVRPGGVWHFIMHGPDYPNKIVFNEIVRPERMAYSHSGDDGEEFRATVTFGRATRPSSRCWRCSQRPQHAIMS